MNIVNAIFIYIIFGVNRSAPPPCIPLFEASVIFCKAFNIKNIINTRNSEGTRLLRYVCGRGCGSLAAAFQFFVNTSFSIFISIISGETVNSYGNKELLSIEFFGGFGCQGSGAAGALHLLLLLHFHLDLNVYRCSSQLIAVGVFRRLTPRPHRILKMCTQTIQLLVLVESSNWRGVAVPTFPYQLPNILCASSIHEVAIAESLEYGRWGRVRVYDTCRRKTVCDWISKAPKLPLRLHYVFNNVRTI